MEGSFADAANNHGFKRARWRRLWRQQIQDWLIAVVQNVRILMRRLMSRALAVEYGEGIYSNTVPVALSNDVSAAFFRVWSPDDDPTNAVIQVCTNHLVGGWTDCNP